MSLPTHPLKRLFKKPGEKLLADEVIDLDGPPSSDGRPLSSFNLPSASDPSILIGNRWLSRGDIAILASTSGMGKSSLSIQAAVTWALGQSLFGGFKPNGALKTLIMQSEDGDGDIAEVRLSLEHAMKLTPEQLAQVDRNLIIKTERVRRGMAFRAELKRLADLHEPDIIIINPLLGFLQGDVNKAEDVGAFLREQLNSLNDPPRFAYVIVHHTAKPPKEKSARQWNEVMYEMAGSADLTNAARAVLSLQATDKKGEFRLIASKRGTRAGLTELVPGVVNPEIKFEQATSEITIRHSTDRMQVDGNDLSVIHWERFTANNREETERKNRGRPATNDVSDFYMFIPTGVDKAMTAPQIYRASVGATGLTSNGFGKVLLRGHKEGKVSIVNIPAKGPCYYR